MKTLLVRVTVAALLAGTLVFTALAQTPRVIEFTTNAVAGDEVNSYSHGFGISWTPPLEPGLKVQVRLKVVDGTARRGQDYDLPASSFWITFRNGQRPQSEP